MAESPVTPAIVASPIVGGALFLLPLALVICAGALLTPASATMVFTHPLISAIPVVIIFLIIYLAA